jgi:modulator of FtsH protease HflC
MNKNYLSVAVGAVLLVIFALLLVVFQVRQTEVVMVTTFGKPTRDVSEPGPYLKWPWPIQKVHRFDKRIHNLEDQFEEMLTRDERNLLVMVYAGWTIADPKLFLPRFGDGSVAEAERALQVLISSHKSAAIGRHPLADLVNADEKQLKFPEIEQEILSEVKPKALASYGVDIKFIGIKRLGLPEKVTEKVFERMKSERQLLANKIKYEGEEQANVIRAGAEKERDRLLSLADAEAWRIRGNADAEAYGSFTVFKQNPELANFILKLNALETVLTNRTTLILDQRTPPFDLLQPAATDLRKAAPRN